MANGKAHHTGEHPAPPAGRVDRSVPPGERFAERPPEPRPAGAQGAAADPQDQRLAETSGEVGDAGSWGRKVPRNFPRRHPRAYFFWVRQGGEKARKLIPTILLNHA